MSLRHPSILSAFDRRTATVTIVSVAALMTTYLVTSAWKSIHTFPTGPKTIDVQGQATRHVAPDTVSWTMTLREHGEDQQSALAVLRTNASSVHEYLIAHGIKDAELDLGAVSTTGTSETTYDDSGNAISPETSGWEATQDITITVKDIKRGVAAHDAAAITDELEDVEVSGAECSANVTDAAKDALLGQARANVRTQAKLALAQYGGATLGKLANASIGSVDIGSDCVDVVLTASASATYEIR